MAKEIEAMTPEQKKLIKEAVASKKIEAIPREEYAKLTKESAQKLIDSKINPKPARQAPEAKGDDRATKHQMNAIGAAVENGEIERLPAEQWKRLTKADATKILSDIWAKRPPEPATESQKEKITELVRAGRLSPMGRDKFHELDKVHASKLISIGKYHEQQGTTVEGYDPNYKPLQKTDPATAGQKDEITGLVKDGYLKPMPGYKWNKLNVELASKMIYIGKQRESLGQKAADIPTAKNSPAVGGDDIPF